MDLPNKAAQDELTDLKEKVKISSDYFKENNSRHINSKNFTLVTSLNETDRAELEKYGKPQLTFNVIEPIISRLMGEFAMINMQYRLVPTDTAPADSDLIDVLISIIRGIFYDSESDNVDNRIYSDCMCGGFGVMKAYSEYANYKSSKQVLKVDSVFDPVLTGFDIYARKPHKGDGKYAFELIPMYLKTFKEQHPAASVESLTFNTPSQLGFQWNYKTINQEKIIYVCDFYLKKETQKMMHIMADGSVLTTNEYNRLADRMNLSADPNALVPAKLHSENRIVNSIWRYRFIETTILECVETDFEHLPLVFFDGNSVTIDCKQTTKPYAYNAFDAQRAKNIIANSIIDELTNMRRTTLISPLQSLPTENKVLMEPYVNPQKQYSSYVYKHIDDAGNPIPAPTPLPRDPIPQELMNFFDTLDNTVQTILGSYDAQLGIQDDDISGKAIINGATQSNSAAKPFIVNYISSMGQMARILLNMIPKLYTTPRTVPTVDKLGRKSFKVINNPKDPNSPQVSDFDPNVFNIYVEAGASFELQKKEALNLLISIAQTNPGLAQLLQQPQGVDVILDNMDINGIDKLKELNEQLQEEQAQQAQQAQSQPQPPDPNLIKAQNDAQNIQLKQQQLQQDAQKNQMDYHVQMTNAQNQSQKNQLEAQESQHDQMQDWLKLMTERDRAHAEIVNAQSSEDRANAELDFKKSEAALEHFRFMKTNADQVKSDHAKLGMDYIKHSASQNNDK